MKVTVPLLLLALLVDTVYAQDRDWTLMMNDPNANFYDIRQSFESYWEGKEVEKGKGWKQFKRWEAYMEPRVYPEGKMPNSSLLAQEFFKMQNGQASILGQWKPLGPFNGASLDGIGRINRIAFDPNNSQIVWAGAPAGGLWKSTDGGSTWSTNTDQLTNLGISDIVIDPLNTSVMYIATGDRDGADTYSYGVLKSIDGGQSWEPTGLTHTVSHGIRITDIFLRKDSTNIVFASTYQGIYRSDDAGDNWDLVQSGAFNEIVPLPGQPDKLFTSTINTGSCRIFKSTDYGQTWSVVSNSVLPTGGTRRIELAVTPADSNYIYALFGNSTDNGFKGLYRSTDQGQTWTLQASSPNLLGWQSSGNDSGGQAWYDLALAVNPADKNDVVVGGVNIWRSSNGGINWFLAAHWYGGGAPFVHADIHHLIFNDQGDLYAGTDGGVYRKQPAKSSWDQLNDGMNITQYYRISAAASDTSRILAGAQDNGTDLLNSSGWFGVAGGDGMDCAINTKNSDVMYASIYYGDFFKSTNGGNSFNATFNLPPSGQGNWVTPFALDPQHPDTLYAGFSRVWRSFDGGLSFSAVSPTTMTSGARLDRIYVAPEDASLVLTSQGKNLWKSTDYGSTWNSVSVPAPVFITGIAVAHDDPDHIIISRSGYSDNQKVYESTDGGNTWTNISNGLPNVPANAVIIEDNAIHSIYVGTDLGVYYRDDNSGGWLNFNNNLPNVIVNDLEINYLNRKLRAGTYGRGVWESPLYSDLVPPVAAMQLISNVCAGDTVQLLDASVYSPDSFAWTITPSQYTFVNGSNAYSQNPYIVFNQKGFYDIALRVENILGKDSVLEVGGITAGGIPLPVTEDFENEKNFSRWTTENPDGNGWTRVSNNGGRILKTSLFNNTSGNHYSLISPAYDLSNTDSVWLNFDHAYSGTGSNQNDSLLVYIASDCKNNWTPIASLGENGTQSFVTTSPASTGFTPSASQWCGASGFAACHTLNLSAYAGTEGVRLKFVAKNAGGNDLYLDNIEISGTPTASPVAGFGSAKEVCALDTILFSDQSYGIPSTYQWTFTGPVNLVSSDRNPEVSFTQAGVYSVKLKVTNAFGSDSVTKMNYLSVQPADSVSISIPYSGNFICPADTFTAVASYLNAGASPVFTWYLNGTEVMESGSDTHSFTGLNNGDLITVSLRSSEECAFPKKAFSDTVQVNVHPAVTLQITGVPTLCESDNPVTLSATPAGGTFSGNGVSGSGFDPASAGGGTHTVTYGYTEPVTGCYFENTTTITVAPYPDITVNSTYSICANDGPTPLSIATPAGGVYSGPGIINNTLFPDSLGAGTHPILYTYNSAACGSVSDTIGLVIHPAPPTPNILVFPNYLECSVTASVYQWYKNGAVMAGANAKTYTPATSGSYRVDILDAQSCYAQSAYVNFNIGLEEIPVETELSIFPNPARDIIYLKMEGNSSGEFDLYLSNSLGAIVKKIHFTYDGSLDQAIDISGMASGIYIISLKGSEIAVERKMVIQH